MVDRLIAELAEQPAEPVAQVVSSGHWELPCLQWMSADHSFRAPIGTKLFAHPDPRIAALESIIRKGLDGLQEPLTSAMATWVIDARIALNDIPPERIEAALGGST